MEPDNCGDEAAIMAELKELRDQMDTLYTRVTAYSLRVRGQLPNLDDEVDDFQGTETDYNGQQAKDFEWDTVPLYEITKPQLALIEAKLKRKLQQNDIVFARPPEMLRDPTTGENAPRARVVVVKNLVSEELEFV